MSHKTKRTRQFKKKIKLYGRVKKSKPKMSNIFNEPNKVGRLDKLNVLSWSKEDLIMDDRE